MKWFKHDSCANRDGKLERVLLKFGADGYALYWLCLELIADRIDSANVDFELEHDAETLGARLKIDTLRVEEIMKFFVKVELFECEGTRITCLKLAERIENSIVKSIQIKNIQEKIRDYPGLSGKSSDNSGQTRCRGDKEKISRSGVPLPAKAPPERDPLEDALWEAFASRNTNPEGKVAYANFPKEHGGAKRLAKIIKLRWPGIEMQRGSELVEKYYWLVTDSQDRFYAKQPFTPSTLSSGIFEGVAKQVDEDAAQTETLHELEEIKF